jgi:hypothetical protein
MYPFYYTAREMVLCIEIEKNKYHHGDTENTEKCTAERSVFSVLSVQGKRLPGGHREGTSFR